MPISALSGDLRQPRCRQRTAGQVYRAGRFAALYLSEYNAERAVPSAARLEPVLGDSMARLLLIDDDPALIPEQVRQAFSAPRFRVDVAGTGREGLERVRSESPDVILLDLRLPD